jgi:hypothetical protein
MFVSCHYCRGSLVRIYIDTLRELGICVVTYDTINSVSLSPTVTSEKEEGENLF